MNIIFTTGVLLIVLSFVFQNNKNNKKIKPYWGFLLVFLIMGFQTGIEGDFMGYKDDYESIGRGLSSDLMTAAGDTVWLTINMIFASLFPFWVFVLALAAFECKVLYDMCRKYGSVEYSWIAPILFFFTYYLMLIEMKALRQGLAVEIMVLAYLMTTRKKGILWSSILMLAAVFTHHSALYAIPFVIYQILASRDKLFDHDAFKLEKKYSIVFPVIMVVAFLFVYALKAAWLGDMLSQLSLLGEAQNMSLTGYLESEQEYAFDISLLIVLYDAVMVFLCSWFYQRTTRRGKVFATASIIGCFGEMLFFGMGSLPRIMTYFYVYNLLTYPLLVEMISKKYGKSLGLVLSVVLVGYAMKTSMPMILSTYANEFGSYRFIFMP